MYTNTGVGIRDSFPGISQYRSRKSGTGTHFKIRDWDRDTKSENPGLATGTGIQN